MWVPSRYGRAKNVESDPKGPKTPTLNRTTMKRLYLPIALLLLITVALASNFQEGPPLKGEVVKAELVDKSKREWKLMVKLLEEPKVVPSGRIEVSRRVAKAGFSRARSAAVIPGRGNSS